MSNKDLLAELRAKVPSKMAPTPPTPPVAGVGEKAAGMPPPRKAQARSTRSAPKAKVARRETSPPSGRGAHFYLEDSDRRIISHLAVWFASQDCRLSDSQVIKAAIRMAESHQGAKLLQLAAEVRASDRRRQPKTGSREAET